jgi:hypothetical protein
MVFSSFCLETKNQCLNSIVEKCCHSNLEIVTLLIMTQKTETS